MESVYQTYDPVDEVICSICKRGNLDITKCHRGKEHVPVVKDISNPAIHHSLDEVSTETFDKMVRQFYIKESELSLIGLQREIIHPIERTLEMSVEDYLSAIRGDPIYDQFLSIAYSTDVSNKLKEMEITERDTIKATNKKGMEYRAAHQEKTKGFEQKFKEYVEKLESEFPDSARFGTHVSGELSDLIIGGQVSRDAPPFITFIQKMKKYLFDKILCIPSYDRYITSMVGPVSADEVAELYIEFFLGVLAEYMREPAAAYLIPVEMYISVRTLDEFFGKRVIYNLTAKDAGRRSIFLNEVKKYQKTASKACSDIRAHLTHFIRTKCLRRSGAEMFIDRVQWETPYMMKTLINITHPYHHSLDVALRDVTLKYIFRDPFSGSAGFRRVTQKGSDQRTVYDFLSLYTALQPSERIKAIIYKQGDDTRVKKASQSVNLRDIPYVKQRDYTIVYLESKREVRRKIRRTHSHQSAQFLTQRQSGTTKHGTDPPHAVFDHRTTTCTITGTSEEIQELIGILNTAMKQSTVQPIGLNLRDGEFVSYKGSMELTTRAKLFRPLLQELFLTEPFSRYFYPYTSSSTSGNYIFVHTPDDIPVPREVNDYISFLIEKEYEKTSVAVVWSVTFEGTSQAQILPFLSMFIALLQMLENVVYDERYRKFHEASQAYLKHVQSLRVQTNSTAIDSTISKKEVYLMLLRETGLTPEQAQVYSDRSRPVPVKIDSENQDKWRKFFASVYSGANIMFSESFSTAEDLETNEKYLDVYANIDINEMGEFCFGAHVIGIPFNGYTFFTYPEGGMLYPMELLMVHGVGSSADRSVPVRSSKHIDREKSTEVSGKMSYALRRSREATPRIREVLRTFSDEVAEHVTFYRPQGDSATYAEYINRSFPKIGILRAILAQHLWDHTDEEIKGTLRTMDLFLHQDMLQNLEGALIFCFIQTKDGYTYQIPRHNQWYAIDTSYTKAMFLFCGTKGQYDVAIFGSKPAGTICTDINDRMRSFVKSSLSFNAIESNPLHASELIRMMIVNRTSRTEIDGQFFDMNGKSTGIRVRSTEDVLIEGVRTSVKKVMDLRFNAQAPIMASREQTSNLKRFTYLSDIQTNVVEKFGDFANDPRFTLIPMPTSSVRYRVSSIYEESRSWKQRNYIFCRMVITHWLIFRDTTTRYQNKPDSPEWGDYDEESLQFFNVWKDKTVQDYINVFIREHREGYQRAHETPDPIMSMIVLDVHHDIFDFGEYLSRIYPSVYYDEAFHVDELELSRVQNYMERELDIIQTYPPEFYTHFVNMRLNMDLLPKKETRVTLNEDEVVLQMHLDPKELIGPKRVRDDIRTTLVKKNLSSDIYYARVSRFNPMMDPLSSSKKSGKVEKAELIMTEIGGILYFIRLTREGHFEIACNICHAWKTQRHLLSYEETGIRDTASRIFELKNDEIVERKDNNEATIRATGEDYHILVYTRVSFLTPKKQVSKVVYAAMLPLE
jgi:hypothetical protein